MRQADRWRGMARAGALGIGLAAALAACDSIRPDPNSKYPGEIDPNRETVFGPGGMNLFGNKKATREETTGIGVNSYLWRASLDTIAFMPLASADPFGGVIITDWYSPPESPSERFKANVFILDRSLRADGVRVAVHRQVRNPAGEWADAPVEAKTATDIEDAILTRARQLRSNRPD